MTDTQRKIEDSIKEELRKLQKLEAMHTQLMAGKHTVKTRRIMMRWVAKKEEIAHLMHLHWTKVNFLREKLQETKQVGGKMTYDAWSKSNIDVQDKHFIRTLKKAPRHDLCLIATGKPDRAAGNLRERQEYYFFDGLNGWAEYDFPKPADMCSIAVSIKLTTADPRPCKIWVDGTPVGTRMEPHFLDKYQTGTYGPEGLRWVTLGELDCPGGRTSVKLKIEPVGYAPHIAAVCVLPMRGNIACTFSPGPQSSKPLPGGTWMHSARNYKVVAPGKLAAELRDRRGGWHSRMVDFRDGDEFDNIDGNFRLGNRLHPKGPLKPGPKIVRVYGDYEILDELDFGGKFDIKNMEADNLDKVCEECERRGCNVFVVCNGRAYLKRVFIADGKPVHAPNKKKTCTMYVHKAFASAIKGGPELWYWKSKNNRREMARASLAAAQMAMASIRAKRC